MERSAENVNRARKPSQWPLRLRLWCHSLHLHLPIMPLAPCERIEVGIRPQSESFGLRYTAVVIDFASIFRCFLSIGVGSTWHSREPRWRSLLMGASGTVVTSMASYRDRISNSGLPSSSRTRRATHETMTPWATPGGSSFASGNTRPSKPHLIVSSERLHEPRTCHTRALRSSDSRPR